MSISHNAPISGVSASGHYVGTAGYDNQVIIWDAENHAALARGCHDHLVNHCEFSPDGTALVSASSDHSARLWSVPQMQLKSLLSGHEDDVMKASFSPDGRWIATCSYDSTLMVFSLDGKVRAVCKGHTGLIESFDWSFDNRLLTSCGTDGTVRQWCAETGACLAMRSGFEYDLDTLITVRDLSFIGTDDGTIIAFNGSDEIVTPAHKSGVKRLVSHGELLLSLGYDQQCTLWLRDGMNLREVASSRFPAYVWARTAAFLDDTQIVFGTFGSTYAIWNWPQDLWSANGYDCSVSLNSVFIGREGTRYAIGDAGRLLRDGVVVGGPNTLCNCLGQAGVGLFTAGQLGTVYDAVTGVPIFMGDAPINCVASWNTSSTTFLVFGTYGGSLLAFESDGRDIHFLRALNLGCNAIKGVCQARGLLFCGSADGMLSILDANTLQIRHSIQGAHDGILNDVAPYSEGFATVSRDRTLRLWNDYGARQQIIKSRHSHSIKCIASNSAGTLLATGSYGGTIDVYSISAGCWLKQLSRPTAHGISSIAWDEGKNQFVASSYDGCLYNVPV